MSHDRNTGAWNTVQRLASKILKIRIEGRSGPEVETALAILAGLYTKLTTFEAQYGDRATFQQAKAHAEALLGEDEGEGEDPPWEQEPEPEPEPEAKAKAHDGTRYGVPDEAFQEGWRRFKGWQVKQPGVCKVCGGHVPAGAQARFRAGADPIGVYWHFRGGLMHHGCAPWSEEPKAKAPEPEPEEPKAKAEEPKAEEPKGKTESVKVPRWTKDLTKDQWRVLHSVAVTCGWLD